MSISNFSKKARPSEMQLNKHEIWKNNVSDSQNQNIFSDRREV